MSVLRYFKKVGAHEPPFLPQATTDTDKAANRALSLAILDSGSGCGADSGRKTRKRRGMLDQETRAKIGRYAAENGNKAAVDKEFNHSVPESTIRGRKTAYLKMLESVDDPDEIQKLPHGLRGRPLKFGEYDDKVKQYIHKLRLAGSIVN